VRPCPSALNIGLWCFRVITHPAWHGRHTCVSSTCAFFRLLLRFNRVNIAGTTPETTEYRSARTRVRSTFDEILIFHKNAVCRVPFARRQQIDLSRDALRSISASLILTISFAIQRSPWDLDSSERKNKFWKAGTLAVGHCRGLRWQMALDRLWFPPGNWIFLYPVMCTEDKLVAAQSTLKNRWPWIVKVRIIRTVLQVGYHLSRLFAYDYRGHLDHPRRRFSIWNVIA